MKRILILSVIVLAVSLGVGINSVKGSDATTSSLTQTTTQTVMYQTYYNGAYYYYTDYQDLISQIYDDVYQEVYDQMFQAMIDSIDQDFYEDIYSQVEADLADVLSQDQINVYLAEFENQMHTVIEHAENSVFGITSYSPDSGSAVGSGVVIRFDAEASKYYILTNYHVVKNYVTYATDYPDKIDELSMLIVFPDESHRQATLVGYDTEVDLAVLSFDGSGLEGIEISTFADPNDISVSDFVLAVGNPLGYDFYNSVTLGIISGLNRKVETDRYVNYVQHDAEINGGNSGGPIYNLNGEIVGINVSKLATIEIEGMGFAIPVEIIERVIERIFNDDLPVNTIMPRLSIDYEMVSDIIDGTEVNLASFTLDGTEYTNVTLTLPTGVTDGALITSIDEFGTLYDILHVGDLIIQVGSHMVTDEESFLDYIYENYEAGDQIVIYYYEFLAINSGYASTISTVTVTFI